MDLPECRKIHGYISDNDNESELSSFDESYEKFKIPPVSLTELKKNLVYKSQDGTIKKITNMSTEEKKQDPGVHTLHPSGKQNRNAAIFKCSDSKLMNQYPETFGREDITRNANSKQTQNIQNFERSDLKQNTSLLSATPADIMRKQLTEYFGYEDATQSEYSKERNLHLNLKQDQITQNFPSDLRQNFSTLGTTTTVGDIARKKRTKNFGYEDATQSGYSKEESTRSNLKQEQNTQNLRSDLKQNPFFLSATPADIMRKQQSNVGINIARPTKKEQQCTGSLASINVKQHLSNSLHSELKQRTSHTSQASTNEKQHQTAYNLASQDVMKKQPAESFVRANIPQQNIKSAPKTVIPNNYLLSMSNPGVSTYNANEIYDIFSETSYENYSRQVERTVPSNSQHSDSIPSLSDYLIREAISSNTDHPSSNNVCCCDCCGIM